MSASNRRVKRSKFKRMRTEQRRYMFRDDFRWNRADLLDWDRYIARSEAAADVYTALYDAYKMTPQQVFDKVAIVQTHDLYQLEVITTLLNFISQPGLNRRWTYEETEKAVNMRAEGQSLEAIALELDRSTQAVANRISQAVGIQKLEVQIQGVIDGDLNHEHAEGQFKGTLRKEKRK